MSPPLIESGSKVMFLPTGPIGAPGVPGAPGLANSAFATRSAMASYAPGGGLHAGDNFFLSEAGREGAFVVDLASSWTAAIAADAAQKGLFVPSTFDATKVYRRVFQGRAVSLWWGVSPSNSASANVAAYNNAISVLEALAVDTTGSGYGYNKGGYPLYTPAGIYQFDSELTTQHAAIQHQGDFTGGIGGGGGTVFKWTSATTHGFNFISNNSGSNSSGSAVRGFWLQGAYDYTTGTRGAYHAVNFTGIITIEDCWASNWPGCGYKGFANIATNPGTQVSNSFFRHIGAEFCDWTIWLDGGDANTCTGLDVTGVANRFGNIKDTSGLGNQWTGGQCEGNGNDPRFHVRCEKSGRIFAVAYGQEAWCSTNSPPASATNNTGWIYLYDSTASTTQPTWASGQTWYFGAPLCFDPTNGSQHSVGVGIYLEDYNPVIMGVRCKLIPGGFDGSIMRFFTGTGTPHGGVILSGSDSGAELLLNGGLQAPAGIHGFGTDHSFGPQSGAAADSATYFDHTNFSSFLYFRHWASGTPSLFAHIQGQSAAGLFYDVNSGLAHNFSVNGAAIVSIPSDGFKPGADNTLKLGDASNRWSTVYAGTGTINTSDRNEKDQIRPLSDAEFDLLLEAVAAVQPVAFKFKDAVAAKGSAARDHYGIIAQDLHDEMVRRGLDPFAGGVLGRDPLFEEVDKPVKVTKPVMRKEIRERTVIERIGKRAVRRVVSDEYEVALTEHVKLFDEDGKRVMIEVRVPQPLGKDGQRRPPKVKRVQATHEMPKMETVEVMEKVQRRKRDEHGEPAWRWNIRPSEFWALRFAALEREDRKAAA